MVKRLGASAALVICVLSSAPAVAQARNSAAPSTLAPKAAVVTNGAWTTYHNDNARDGYDPSAPIVSSPAPTPGWTLATLDGEVYAETLIYQGVVYAATLNNTVYALNQADGTVIWSKNVGAPQTSGWVCGNISQSGILGTPVIDAAANRIYVAAEIAGSTPTYHLFGLDLANAGNVVLDVPLTAAGFDWKIQQERGALAVANGYVYVPMGGRDGDCFDGSIPYYGWVFGVPTSGVGAPNVYQTPSTAESVWAAGGVVVDDTSHNVFFSTGNAIPCGTATYSDAVVRVTPTLTSPTFFEPNDWQANWCGPDEDLGSTSPVLISPTLMFMAGKRGGGFLLNPTALGGVDGQLFPTPKPAVYAQAEVCLGNHSAATYGSFAYLAPFVYVECEGRGLVALNVNTSTPSFTPCGTCTAPDWNVGGSTTFGPPIVAGGAVWVASGNGLTAFNATTGALMYQSAAFGVNRFVTPSEAGGQVFVPSHNVVRSFSMAGAVTLTPSSLGFGGQAPGTTSTAQTVTLHNNLTVTLNITTAALTGANAASYVKGADTCTAAAVAPSGTCTVQVSFAPPGAGGRPASLTFTDNGPGSPRTVPLNGMGGLDNQTFLYTLDGYGGLHANGSAAAMTAGTYWPGWNIARGLSLFSDGTGGYVIDGYGGLHPFGSAGAASGNPYWQGFDIARQVVLAPWSTAAAPAGWTLDGYGGIHPFGGAPAVSGAAYWGGWDIVRGLAILPDSTPSSVAGYTLDGWGGVHPFGGAPAVGNAAYWPGMDLARGIALSPDASLTNAEGWTVDAYGGVHPFGSASAVSSSSYWPGWDIARGLVAWTGAGSTGGWVLDGYGGLHPFGGAPGVSNGAYWAGWDIATGLAGPAAATGSHRRT
jgi:PQQ-like domain